MELFLGYDPGGDGKHGVASVRVAADGSFGDLRTDCLRAPAQEVVGECGAGEPGAVGEELSRGAVAQAVASTIMLGAVAHGSGWCRAVWANTGQCRVVSSCCVLVVLVVSGHGGGGRDGADRSGFGVRGDVRHDRHADGGWEGSPPSTTPSRHGRRGRSCRASGMRRGSDATSSAPSLSSGRSNPRHPTASVDPGLGLVSRGS